MYVLFFFITSTEIKTVLLGRNWPVQDGVYCAGKLSAEAEAVVYLLKCEANSHKVWLRHKLEVDQEYVMRIRSIKENAGKDLKAMIGRLEATDAKLKLEEHESEGGRDIP